MHCSSWFHTLCHSCDNFYQAPLFLSCNVENLGEGWVQGYSPYYEKSLKNTEIRIGQLVTNVRNRGQLLGMPSLVEWQYNMT